MRFEKEVKLKGWEFNCEPLELEFYLFSKVLLWTYILCICRRELINARAHEVCVNWFLCVDGSNKSSRRVKKKSLTFIWFSSGNKCFVINQANQSRMKWNKEKVL